MPNAPKRPTTITSTALGTYNPNGGTGMPAPPPNSQTRGPVQLHEQFSDRDEPKTWARSLNRIQSAIKLALGIVKGVPFLAQGGNLIAGVSFGSGSDTIVQHGLGRPFVGYMVVNVSVDYGSFKNVGNFVNGVRNPALDTFQITLVSLNRCQGDVWVY